MKRFTQFLLLSVFVLTTLFMSIPEDAQAADYVNTDVATNQISARVDAPLTNDGPAIQNSDSNWKKIWEKGDVSVWTNGNVYAVILGGQIYVFATKSEAMAFARAAGGIIPYG